MTDAARRCIEHVLRHEGGYSNNPADPGGETNYGISKRAYPTLDIRALTRSDAIAIYERDYWQPIHGDALPEPVALALLDFAVNSGLTRAKRLLNAICFVPVDQAFSAEAVAKRCKDAGAVTIAEQLIRERALYLADLGCRRPGMSDFLAGWFRRIAANLRAVRAFEEG